MSEEIKIEGTEKTRRSAIKTAAQVAITAPAVGLLLSAGTKAASAQRIYAGDDGVAKDDFILNDDVITLGDDSVPGGTI